MRILIIVISICIAGCGESSDTIKDSSQDTIMGSWSTNCYLGYDDPENIWVVSEYHISEEDFDQVHNHFSNDNCTASYTGTSNPRMGGNGTYEFLNDVDTTSGIPAKWYRLTYDYSSLLDPSLRLSIQTGFYVSSDTMIEVVERDGFYYISDNPTYYLQ